MALVLVGCGSKRLSVTEKRSMTTKVFSQSYDKTFPAILAIYQDKGYQIKSADKSSGLIVAQSNKSISETSRVFQNILIGKPMTEGSKTEISTTVKSLKDGKTKVRLNIQETEYSKRGGLFSSGTTAKVKQINNKKVYVSIFSDIEKELLE